METYTLKGYSLALTHLKERKELGQTIEEALEGMERVYKNIG